MILSIGFYGILLIMIFQVYYICFAVSKQCYFSFVCIGSILIFLDAIINSYYVLIICSIFLLCFSLIGVIKMVTQIGKVRPIERLDVPQLEKLSDWTEKDIIEFVAESRTRFYVVEEGENNIIGFLAFSAEDEFAAEIIKLVVDKNYHNSGFEELLFNKAISLSKSARNDTLEVIVEDKDDYLIKFYNSKKPTSSKLLKGKKNDSIKFVFELVGNKKTSAKTS